jgi:hypothetical protein
VWPKSVSAEPTLPEKPDPDLRALAGPARPWLAGQGIQARNRGRQQTTLVRSEGHQARLVGTFDLGKPRLVCQTSAQGGKLAGAVPIPST